MKKHKLLLPLLALVVFFSCNKKDELTSPSKQNPTPSSNLTITEASGQEQPIAKATVAISSIGGGSISPYFSNGKWLGNVPACGSGSFYGY
jgi:ABC-type Fe3+-hydroxamate transport system substrate-binding protein